MSCSVDLITWCCRNEEVLFLPHSPISLVCSCVVLLPFCWAFMPTPALPGPSHEPLSSLEQQKNVKLFLFWLNFLLCVFVR